MLIYIYSFSRRFYPKHLDIYLNKNDEIVMVVMQINEIFLTVKADTYIKRLK